VFLAVLEFFSSEQIKSIMQAQEIVKNMPIH